jgi:hypothetical protein
MQGIGVYLVCVHLLQARMQLVSVRVLNFRKIFIPVGIPLCWVAYGGVLWCPRMVPQLAEGIGQAFWGPRGLRTFLFSDFIPY